MDADNVRVEERELLQRVSNAYDNRGFDSTLAWYSYQSLKPYFVGASCLELGPADGEMTYFLKDDFDRLAVVDALPEFVDGATRLGPNVTGYVSLFEEFEPPESFDTVILADVLEHVQDPVVLLKRAGSWLRPGGRLIAAVPNADSLHRCLGVKMGMLERKTSLNEGDFTLGHRRVYTRDELDLDLRAANLRIIAKGGIFLKPLSNGQMASFQNPALYDGLFELGKDLPQLCSQIYAVCEPGPAPRRPRG
jgi:2-polyprenyl-3-methyl-5-hydroxy-6-metoxy-1,4-benzoquinol methylase